MNYCLFIAKVTKQLIFIDAITTSKYHKLGETEDSSHISVNLIYCLLYPFRVQVSFVKLSIFRAILYHPQIMRPTYSVIIFIEIISGLTTYI